jgi:hypothetical protein
MTEASHCEIHGGPTLPIVLTILSRIYFASRGLQNFVEARAEWEKVKGII